MNRQETESCASPWLSPADAARYAGVPETRLKRAHREGQIGGVRLGYRTLVFRRDDIDAWLSASYEPARWVPVPVSVEASGQLVPLPAKRPRRRAS